MILDVLRQSLSTRSASDATNTRTPGGNTSDPCLWGVLVIHIGSSDGVLLRFYILSPPKNLHLLHRNIFRRHPSREVCQGNRTVRVPTSANGLLLHAGAVCLAACLDRPACCLSLCATVWLPAQADGGVARTLTLQVAEQQAWKLDPLRRNGQPSVTAHLCGRC